MNSLILINGPNGVGKSSVCKRVHQRLSRSARLESEWCRMINPFVFNEDTIQLTIDNMTQLLGNYLSNAWIDYVIIPYGFHGERRKIWDTVINNLRDIPYTYIPITLNCTERENISRMKQDGRDQARIKRALTVRHLYENLPYPIIDSTKLTIEETSDRVLEKVHASV